MLWLAFIELAVLALLVAIVVLAIRRKPDDKDKNSPE